MSEHFPPRDAVGGAAGHGVCVEPARDAAPLVFDALRPLRHIHQGFGADAHDAPADAAHVRPHQPVCVICGVAVRERVSEGRLRAALLVTDFHYCSTHADHVQ